MQETCLLSTLIETQNQGQQKCEETKCNQCVLYAITIASKFGIRASSAKCNSNVHRMQLSSTDNNEVYIH